MSKVQMLRDFINLRLTSAVEEIVAVFERTMAEYEEEIDRQRDLLRGGGGPDIHETNTAGFPANVKMLTEIDEVPPVQQQWSSSLDQQYPETTHIKEEQTELWTSQQGEKGADICPVIVTTEDDEASSSAKQMKTEAEEGECGGAEQERLFQPATNQTSNSSQDGDDAWKQSGCSERLSSEEHLHTGRKKHTCSYCGNNFSAISSLTTHLRTHTGEKPFTCSVCTRSFSLRCTLVNHMRVHTGEKPFACSMCSKSFSRKSNLTTHFRTHTGEKPFICSVCKRGFKLRQALVTHMRVHTGEKPFACSMCNKSFSKKTTLSTHMALHTLPKPFKCSVCERRFAWQSQVKNHMCVVEAAGEEQPIKPVMFLQ